MKSYAQIVRYVSETPWAILPSKLALIVDLVRFRAEGGQLSDEEIALRLEAARKGQPTTVQTQGASTIGVLPLRGILVPHAGMMVDVSTAGTDLEGWAQQFQELVNDPSVGAIVLDVFSPGGSVGLVQETAAIVAAARGSKPIVASVNTQAASAAYWIASACDEICMSPSADVGSIGVYAAHQDISKALEMEGISVTLISAGDFKTEGNPFGPLSDEAIAYAQGQVDQTYNQFVNDVAKGRGVSADVVLEKYGQGRVLSAPDARKAGMVDRIETIGQTLTRLQAAKPKATGARRAESGDLELAAAAFAGMNSGGGTSGISRVFTEGITIGSALHDAASTEFHGTEFHGFAIVPSGILDQSALEAYAAASNAGPIPYTKTDVIDEPWDAGEELKKLPSKAAPLRAMHAWVDGTENADAKASYKFPHHKVSDAGEPGPANVNGVRNALARLPDSDIPDGDKDAVKAHLQHHLDDFHASKDGGSSDNADKSSGVTTQPQKETTAMGGTIAQLVARQDEAKARQDELHAEYEGQQFPESVRAEFAKLDQEWAELEDTIVELKQREAALSAKARGPRQSLIPGTEDKLDREGGLSGFNTNAGRKGPDNIWDVAAYRSHASSIDELNAVYKDGAMRAIDGAVFPLDASRSKISSVPDPKAHVARLLGRDRDGTMAKHVLLTGSERYRRAWSRASQGMPITAQDKQALDMYGLTIGTPSDGGYAIPYTLDPTVILASNGAVNPIRAISRQAQITGHQWLGVTTSDGVVASYGPEETAATDNSPTLAQPVLEVEKAQAFVPLSIEVSQDWVGVEEELAKLFADAKDVLEATKFFLGAGHTSHEPEGIITALVAAGGSSIVYTGAPNTFARDDLYTLEDEVAPRFEPNSVFVANRAFYNGVRAVTDDTFNIFVQIQKGTGNDMGGNTGNQLLGYPCWRASAMSTGIDTGGEAIAILGDFEQFLVVDRIGMSVEFIPHLFDTGTGYPLGVRGLYAWWRNSSQCLTANAFRLLTVDHS